jgi:hypothetical protein
MPKSEELLAGALSHLSVKLGCGVITMNEQEKLARYFYELQHNKKPVARASYRNMALTLYFELYIF